MSRLQLPQVTLCAVSSVNIAATVAALTKCLDQADFARCLLFTDGVPYLDDSRIEHIAIDHLGSSSEYSNFILRSVSAHIATSHCLLVQWDGFVIDAKRWKPEFLDYDYIGASWPQFSDDYKVGNGGFSLRSRRLMNACASSEFQQIHPEDVAIGRLNRALLQDLDMRFPTAELADEFSAERAGSLTESFGFHGVFNMQKVLGDDAFWRLYDSLDDQSSFSRDRWRIFKQAQFKNKLKAIKMMFKTKFLKGLRGSVSFM